MEEQILAQVKQNAEKLDAHEVQIDAIARMTIENKSDIEEIKQYLQEEVATKQDIQDIHGTLDEILAVVKKTDQEQVFMGQRVSRNEENIRELQTVVGL